MRTFSVKSDISVCEYLFCKYPFHFEDDELNIFAFHYPESKYPLLSLTDMSDFVESPLEDIKSIFEEAIQSEIEGRVPLALQQYNYGMKCLYDIISGGDQLQMPRIEQVELCKSLKQYSDHCVELKMYLASKKNEQDTDEQFAAARDKKSGDDHTETPAEIKRSQRIASQKTNLTEKISDIIGNEEALSIVKRGVKQFLDPIDDCPPPKGIILWGPPGCGKTMMARACAAEAKDYLPIFELTSDLIQSSWSGNTIKRAKQYFEMLREVG